jgi:hypothetical protein
MRRRAVLLLCGLSVACGRAGFEFVDATDGARRGVTVPEWTPANLRWEDVPAASADLELERVLGNPLFNTDTGALLDGNGQPVEIPGLALAEVVQGPSFPPISILSVRSLRLGVAQHWRITGTRALAVVSAGDIALSGVIDLCGGRMDRAEAGPGGFAGGSHDQPAQGPGAPRATSSGGGHLSPGGASGTGAGGTAYGNAALSPLVGGSGGAQGSHWWIAGGGGGGAIEFVAQGAVRIEAGGGVTACGAAGQDPNASDHTGSGGGAGGAILIEAPTVEVRGVLAANGGGGAGAGIRTSSAAAGALDDTPAAGGVGSLGSGGVGGAGSSAPGAATGGGGGGSAGRIRIRTRGQPLIEGVISPGEFAIDEL